MTDHISRLAQLLQSRGIQQAFGVAGSGDSLSLISALEEKGIRYFPVAHEASAALMAGACSRKGKTAATAITIKGPGFANLVPGILSNYYENRPAVSISEAYGEKAPSSFMHKRLDHIAVSRPIVKGYGWSSSNDDVLGRLFDIASRETPGPVHIDLCEKTQEVRLFPSDARPESRDAATGLRAVLDRIDGSSRPAVILGSLASRSLLQFSWNNAGVPVATTAAAKGVMDEYSPLAAGIITGEIKEYAPERSVLEKADLLVAIGLRHNEVIRPVPFGAPLIIIDVIDSDMHTGFSPDLIHITRNLAEVADSITKALSRRAWGEDIVSQYRQEIEEELLKEKWLPASVLKAMQETLGDSTILALDTGLFCIVGETVWKCRTPDLFCSSSIGRFMGVSIPTAIGVSLSSPGKTVVCVAGDGGIRPYFPEIRLAVEEKLPIVFVLMSDGGYGTIALGARTKKAPSRAYDFSAPAWHVAAEAIGCSAKFVSSIEDVKADLKNWKKAGPLFLEMKFDREKYINAILKLR